MILTASLTIVSLIASVILALSGLGSPLAVAHLAFAVGIVPLIFAAMIHFVPVLTRTGDPARRLVLLPSAAQVSGLLAVTAMQGWLPYRGVHLAAMVDLILAAMLIYWMIGRARAALGSPHPGWRWYGAAVGCLMLALLAILLIAIWPSYWRSLRLFHLHLNILGFVGLAALGTLPVLLPTALGKPDPEAGNWLRRRWWLAGCGVLIIALGAAIKWEFAAPGTALLLVAACGLLGQWLRRFGFSSLLRDGVTASLLAAVLGLLLALVFGLLHGAGLMSTQPSLPAWACGFLLPLVTGALSQLLPVWRWPGPQIPARLMMRQKLAASGLVRAALFLLAAMAMMTGLRQLGAALLAFALALFVIGLLQAVRVLRSTR